MIKSLDSVDITILKMIQNDGQVTLKTLAEAVGMKPPSVLERIKRLEQSGIIVVYAGILDAKLIGLDITSFIGVNVDHPKNITVFEQGIPGLGDEIMECHHVTGDYTLLLKVKTRNTRTLESLIEKIRSIPGVMRTYTMVAFSTLKESHKIPIIWTGEHEEQTRRPGGKARK